MTEHHTPADNETQSHYPFGAGIVYVENPRDSFISIHVTDEERARDPQVEAAVRTLTTKARSYTPRTPRPSYTNDLPPVVDSIVENPKENP